MCLAQSPLKNVKLKFKLNSLYSTKNAQKKLINIQLEIILTETSLELR